MKRDDIFTFFKRLAQKLSDENESRRLIVCGGAAMLLLNIDREETMDVDILRPDRDFLLKQLSAEIAQEIQFAKPNWLNSDCSVFFYKNPLPDNWEDRLVLTFKESGLEVYSLSQDDILITKICCHLDRELDEEDIRLLSNSKEQFEKASDYVLGLDQFNSSEVARVQITELKIRLGYED